LSGSCRAVSCDNLSPSFSPATRITHSNVGESLPPRDFVVELEAYAEEAREKVEKLFLRHKFRPRLEVEKQEIVEGKFNILATVKFLFNNAFLVALTTSPKTEENSL
jgi:hypothetical protein